MVCYEVIAIQLRPRSSGQSTFIEGVEKIMANFVELGKPIARTSHEPMYVPSGENVAWENNDGTTVFIKHVGKSCFISKDAIFGNDVWLGDCITIHREVAIGLKTMTILKSGTVVLAYAMVDGAVSITLIRAYAVVEDGIVKYSGKS